MRTDLVINYGKKTFEFKQPSGTSRGILTQKKSWFLEVSKLNQPNVVGIGECSVIGGLSPEYTSDLEYEKILDELIKNPTLDLASYPSIQFGLETALLDLANGGKGVYFLNDFARGLQKIPINGLVWMGSTEFMQDQIESKIHEGYTTIKLKIGAIDSKKEMDLLEGIRKRYNENEITIRVDANGAFGLSEAKVVLQRLRELHVHSIEQPIAKGNWEEMALLSASNIIPIALDEELIGIYDLEAKMKLLTTIQPQFIVLKPSLHGGISGCREWISLAEELGIGWWMTSALESNIGLDAIAQFTAEFKNELPQGLGTGSLYLNNIESDLTVEKGYIFKKNPN
jgi:o-succinylbenzoate synthase